MIPEKDYRTSQDRVVATWWLDEAIKKAKSYNASGMVAYTIFTERMIKNKFRIDEWHLEYIGKAFNFKPMWSKIKYEKLYPQHK